MCMCVVFVCVCVCVCVCCVCVSVVLKLCGWGRGWVLELCVGGFNCILLAA